MNEAADADVANDDADVFQLALSRFDVITSAVQEERALNLQDRRFGTIAGAQWEDQWFEQFENSIRVEINKAALGAERIAADYREHRMIVDFRAIDKGADDKTAETLNGMFRADFYRSHGQQATDNAFDEAVYGGIGGWRLTTSYVDPYDPEDDRKQIDFAMVPDADQCMFFDLDAKLQSKADAKFGFLLTAMTPDAYKAAFNDDPASWPTNLLKTYYDWYTPDVVYVAEYYVVEETRQKRFNLVHKVTGEEQTLWNADIDPEDLADMQTEGWKIDRTRSIPRRRIRKYVLSASGILGPQDGIIIAGDRIPLIPVYGKRWFVDNMERTRGHIRLAKDPQRVYNANVSKLVETASYSPIERPIVTPAQIAGHGEAWASANIDRAPYVQLNPTVMPDGSEQLPQELPMLRPPSVAPANAALLQIAAQDIAELTQSDDGADQVQANVSADAMDIAATRTDKRSLPYIDNMKQAWQCCGEVWQSMAKDVYVEELREVDTVDAHDEQSTAVLMQPTTDPKTGVFGYANDIHTGRYKCIADVTEATATRRDKTVKTLMNLAQITGATNPELSNAAQITAILNMDGEGMTDFQDWTRQQALKLGLVKPTDEEKAEIAQAAQQPQQPSPEEQMVAAKLAEVESETNLNNAKTQQIGGEIQSGQAEVGTKQTQSALNLANAQKSAAQAKHIGILANRDHKQGIIDRIKSVFVPDKPSQ